MGIPCQDKAQPLPMRGSKAATFIERSTRTSPSFPHPYQSCPPVILAKADPKGRAEGVEIHIR